MKNFTIYAVILMSLLVSKASAQGTFEAKAHAIAVKIENINISPEGITKCVDIYLALYTYLKKEKFLNLYILDFLEYYIHVS